DKTTDSTESRMDDFRKRLLGFIVGIMIIAFTFTCFCLLHYNCMIEEVPSPGGLNKENMAAISSWVSKVSACQPDMVTEDALENQPLLSNSGETSRPLYQGKRSTPNCAAKSIQPSSLEKPSIPSNAQKSVRYPNTENPSSPGTVKKSSRQLSSKRPTKSSRPQRLHKSSHLEKPYKKRNLKKSHKLSRAYKLASQSDSSFSGKQVIPPWVAILQTSCPSVSNNRIVSTKSSRIKKPSQLHGLNDLKRPVSTGKSVLPNNHPSAKVCRHYKDKCLTCNTSEFLLNNLSGPKKEYLGNLQVSRKMNPSTKPFYKTDYKYNESEHKYNYYQENDSNDTTKTYDSEDSDAEILFI
ncbi:hypothetical protein HispidOSU_020541, partial [Sigmodon hispidus]